MPTVLDRIIDLDLPQVRLPEIGDFERKHPCIAAGEVAADSLSSRQAETMSA